MVHVTWKLDDEGVDLHFSWKECGGPVVGMPNRNGFGHVVLTKAIPASLAGRASLEFQPEGAAWTLVAPVRHLVANTML